MSDDAARLLRLLAADAEQRLAADLVSDLVSGAGEPERRRERAAAAGLDLAARWTVAVARLPASAHLRGAEQAARAAAPPAALVGRHAGDLVVLAPAAEPAELARALGNRLAPLGEATCSAAGPVAPDDIAGDYREAAQTVEALLALGRGGSAATAEALGFAGLVLSARPDVDRFLLRQLGALLDYDAGHGIELLATVRAFFDTGLNRRRAAELLHIHPNTLAQRLDRVGRLLGPGWSEPAAALELQLALRLHRLGPRR
ncbi:MAG TPA: helix-turn-helix domain-containing protein [Jatrophihabitans sp.]|nr:helix-turn-helix domain-containing protein [Jatrophihabitans sp.]